MSDMAILDGKGNGLRAFVDDDHRLGVTAETQDFSVIATAAGNAFGVNTGDITLTSGNTSGVFYLKNNEDLPIVVYTVIYQILASTGGGSNAGAITVVRNPTGGTLISTATAVPVRHNLNFGSSNTITADIYKGFEGATFTGGDNSARTISTFPFRASLLIPGIYLPRGSSLGLTVTPPTGNTSVVVNIGTTFFLSRNL